MQNKKEIFQKVNLLVKAGGVKDDFKIKSFFNVPEYVSLLKKCNISLVKLIEEIHLLSKNYYLNSIVRIEVIFFTDNSLSILNKGLISSNLILSLINEINSNQELFELSFKNLILILYILLKNRKLDLYNKILIYDLFKNTQGVISSFGLKNLLICQK